MELSALLKIAPFRGMDEDDMIAFLFATPNSLRRYAPGDIIALQGDRCKGLYILASGAVRAGMVNADGKELTIEEIKAPALLASAFVFATENRFPVMIEATEPCELFFVGRDRFMQAMLSSPVMLGNFLTDISDRSVFLSRKVSEFALLDLKKTDNEIPRYPRGHTQPARGGTTPRGDTALAGQGPGRTGQEGKLGGN